jgi:hypothetical protein
MARNEPSGRYWASAWLVIVFFGEIALLEFGSAEKGAILAQ